MDRTVPAGAAILLDFIRDTEVGTDGREGYDIIYSNRQNRLSKPITKMSLLELQRGQANRWNGLVKSSASGGYQFMYKTLGGLIEELRLNVKQIFTPDLQDRLGYHLLKRRKYLKWADGRISDEDFAKYLAMEWASFPVLRATQGARRMLSPGQSYYAGDGLNKALVSTSDVRAKLQEARAAIDAAEPQPEPEPDVPEAAPPPVSEPIRQEIEKTIERVDKPLATSKTNWLAGIVAALGAFGTFISGLHPVVQGGLVLMIGIGAVLIWCERKQIRDAIGELRGAAER